MLILYIFTSSKNPTQDPNPKNPRFSGSGSSVFSELTVTGRPTRSTDVHNTVHVYISRPTRSTDVHLLSQEFSVDRPGRPMNPNGHIFDRWRSTDPVDRDLSKVLTDPTASLTVFLFGICLQRVFEDVFDPYK